MKKILLLNAILMFSFNSNAKVINGVNLNQKYNCVVSKVHRQPNFESWDKYNIKPGAKLINQNTKSPMMSPQDLIEDRTFLVEKYETWHYDTLKKAHKSYEKQCKGPCLIYSTPRQGRWVFYPQRNGTLNADYDKARHPDFKKGFKLFSFKCIKSRK